MADDVLSVIIPIKDEAATIEQLVSLVEEVGVPAMSKEVILVDDGSSDSTYQLLRRYEGRQGYVVLRHTQNQGKVAAIRTGLARATGSIVTIKAMPLRCRRFELCPEVTGLLQGVGEPIVEVPVTYTGHDREAGKRVRAKDGLIAVVWLLHARFGRRRDQRELARTTR